MGFDRCVAASGSCLWGGDDLGELTTIEQCAAMNERLQAHMVQLVGKGVQCQQDIRNNHAAVRNLTPCGPCCERTNGTTGKNPLSPGSLDFYLFPQSCAANREEQYCTLTKWKAVRDSCKAHVVGYDDGPWAKADEVVYKSMYEGIRLKTEAIMGGVLEHLKELKDQLQQKQTRHNLKKNTRY